MPAPVWSGPTPTVWPTDPSACGAREAPWAEVPPAPPAPPAGAGSRNGVLASGEVVSADRGTDLLAVGFPAFRELGQRSACLEDGLLGAADRRAERRCNLLV